MVEKLDIYNREKIKTGKIIERKEGVKLDKEDVRVSGTVTFNYILVAATVAVIAAIMIIVSKTVSGPAKRASKELGTILNEIENGDGDLTKRLTVKTKDEVGQLVVGFNSFIESLQRIMSKLKVDAENLLASADFAGCL